MKSAAASVVWPTPVPGTPATGGRDCPPMNLLAFSNCPLDPVLGSGRTRRAWRDGLRARGHRVEVFDTVDLLGADGSRPTGRRRRLAWRAWRRLAARDLGDVDLIEFYGAEFVLPTVLLGRRPRARRPLLIAHTDGLELLAHQRLRELADPWSQRLRAEGVHRLNTAAFAWADGVVAGCEADRRCLLEFGLQPPERVAVVPVGLEEPFLRAAQTGEGNETEPTRRERIVCMGSWIPRKGVETLAAVMTDLLRARPGLRLTLLGTGNEAARAEAAFPESVRARVEVAPRLTVAELVAALHQAGIFFFPSRYEGFGLALAEAMACGCAAVTTPTGLGAELRDGEEALVCPFDDAPAMRAALERLLDDDGFRQRVARAGRARAQTLCWDGCVAQLEAVYTRWLGKRNDQ